MFPPFCFCIASIKVYSQLYHCSCWQTWSTLRQFWYNFFTTVTNFSLICFSFFPHSKWCACLWNAGQYFQHLRWVWGCDCGNWPPSSLDHGHQNLTYRWRPPCASAFPYLPSGPVFTVNNRLSVQRSKCLHRKLWAIKMLGLGYSWAEEHLLHKGKALGFNSQYHKIEMLVSKLSINGISILGWGKMIFYQSKYALLYSVEKLK